MNLEANSDRYVCYENKLLVSVILSMSKIFNQHWIEQNISNKEVEVLFQVCVEKGWGKRLFYFTSAFILFRLLYYLSILFSSFPSLICLQTIISPHIM